MKNLILSTVVLTIISLGHNSVQAQESGVVADVTNGTAVEAKTTNGTAVEAKSVNGIGINTLSNQSFGLRVESTKDSHAAAYFINNFGWGIRSIGKIHGGIFEGTDGQGIIATSVKGNGVFATSTSGTGVYGEGGDYAGFFKGRVNVTGVVTAQNISQSSDRNLKSNFASIDGQDVLKRLMTVPIQKWNYKNESSSVLHIGPMAQDFSKAFGVGYDDKTISTVDANGVALAAIQELYKMIQEKDKQITELAKEVEALKKKEPTGKASAKNNHH